MKADINGCALFYEETGEGTPLLFLHGLTGRGDDWQFIGHDLAEGRRFITPDIRGHGRSTNPAGCPIGGSRRMPSRCSIVFALGRSRRSASARVATRCCTWPRCSRRAWTRW